MGKSTYTISFIICPICGFQGELKLRPRNGFLYEYVDHYRGLLYYYYKGNYLRSCYLGRFY